MAWKTNKKTGGKFFTRSRSSRKTPKFSQYDANKVYNYWRQEGYSHKMAVMKVNQKADQVRGKKHY